MQRTHGFSGWFSAVMFGGMLLAGASEAWAQRPAHFVPARPPMSPYFGYSMLNTTGLPSYYATVRPAQNFAAMMQYTQSTAAREAAAARYALDDQAMADLVAERIVMRQNTGIGSVNQASTFQNHSHYYKTPAPAIPVRAR